jgi:hypothetical protein
MSESQTFDSPQDIGTAPKDIVRRWLLELKIADKEEKDWRKTGGKIYDIYNNRRSKKHAFNILWPNTEILRPALYNTLPKPDIRRRFKDDDPIGKAISDVLNRAIEFSLDSYNFDYHIKNVVLDCLLPGRGIARVRYVPSFNQAPENAEDSDQETQDGDIEELAWEQATIEHVQWDDFRHGTGKTWDEVNWIAFRHRLTRDEMIEQFGEDIGKKVTLIEAKDEDLSSLKSDDSMKDIFKTGEVWEIWNKEDKEVIFISDGYRAEPLKIIDDPLGLDCFYPIPCPLYAIENTISLIPTPMFEMYREQADELNEVSIRINKLIQALKVRGIYDATLTEVAGLMTAAENTLVPATNLAALTERGGFQNIIWFAPIEQLATVLAALYQQRDQCKQVIYELTGISDILRGASNPNETASAQNIKSQWGSIRLQRLQRDVQRFIRDLIRMMAEIIAEKFQPETLKQMTMLPYPSEQDVQAQMMQYQQIAAQAQQQGQQPPPPPQKPMTWEDVIATLRNDTTRTYKIDIETDSTIAATQQTDMAALNELMGGIVQLINGLSPAVQAGAVPIEVVKELTLAICRRAKMGNVVEDVLDKIKEPAQKPDPAAAQQQADQQKLAHEQQLKQIDVQANAQIEQMRQQSTIQIETGKLQAQAALDQQKMQHENQLKMADIQKEKEIAAINSEFERWKAQLQADTSIVVAQINASKQTVDVSQTEQIANNGI